MAVSYYDRFMRSPSRPTYEKDLTALVCVLLAAKFDGDMPRRMHDLVRRASFTREDRRAAENGVLRTLEWKMHVATPYTFLEQLQPVAEMRPLVRARAEYFVYISHFDHRLLGFAPAVVAVAALVCSRRQRFRQTARGNVEALCRACGVGCSEVARCAAILL